MSNQAAADCTNSHESIFETSLPFTSLLTFCRCSFSPATLSAVTTRSQEHGADNIYSRAKKRLTFSASQYKNLRNAHQLMLTTTLVAISLLIVERRVRFIINRLRNAIPKNFAEGACINICFKRRRLNLQRVLRGVLHSQIFK